MRNITDWEGIEMVIVMTEWGREVGWFSEVSQEDIADRQFYDIPLRSPRPTTGSVENAVCFQKIGFEVLHFRFNDLDEQRFMVRDKDLERLMLAVNFNPIASVIPCAQCGYDRFHEYLENKRAPAKATTILDRR